MFWIVFCLVAFCLMSLSTKHLGSPVAFLGLGYVAFCFTLLIGVVLKVVGLSLS